MPLSACTSETSVSSLLDDDRSPRRNGLDVGCWAAGDSAQAAAAYAEPGQSHRSPTDSDADSLHSPSVLQLRLEVATGQLTEQKTRIRGLETQVRDLQARLSAAESKDGSTQLSQTVLVQRVQELEAALAASKQVEQERAAQLARLEGRAAVAEGSLKATEQQLGQGLAELQAQHAAALTAQREQHVRELGAERERHEAAAASAKTAWEARLNELSSSKASLEATVRREQRRVRELQAQLDKEGSKQEAVRELMRHSEALQAQVDRLQSAAHEERRRAVKAAQAAEAAVQQERQLADMAAQEAQQKVQEATREHDKALRQARAKQQRAESELRAAKQQAVQQAGRMQELEALNAKKDLQLDAAVQQVSLMQHELEALRQGLSGRQAAALEAARSEYATALANCHAELEAAKARLSEEALAAGRQLQALASILRILGVHAGEEEAASAASASQLLAGAGSRGPSNPVAGDAHAAHLAVAAAPDPDKVVAFVEAVSSSMLDLQQQWELEKAEMAAALEAAEAVHGQLGELLERERQENRGMAGEGAEMAVTLRGMQAELQAAREQLQELDAAKTARAAVDAALEACRCELSTTVAKAAAAADDAAKWQGTAAALEARLEQLSATTEAAQREAQAAKEELEAKEGRIAEMRSAMAAAMAERSSSVAGMSSTLAQVQAALAQTCQPARQHLQAVLAVLAEEREPKTATLAAELQQVAELLHGLPPVESAFAACVGTLGRIVEQLAAGYSHVAAMTQEQEKVHHILSSVNAQLQAAAEAHPSRLQAGAAPGKGGPASPGNASSAATAGNTTSGSGLTLVELLQRLTESVVGLVEGLAVEKECLESQMLQATDESAQLRNQLQSMQAVLASLQSHTALEHQEALFALEQARLRLSELQQENDELAQRAQQAQQTAEAVRASATREWTSMKDELSGLVEQAEQAQLSADAACQRQREEYEDRLARAAQQAAEAAAGRAAAEAGAERLKRELCDVRRGLAAAEEQVAAKEEALRSGLQASRAEVQELEEKVTQLQRQLANRARKGGINAAPAKKAAAASCAVGALKRENQRLKDQVEGLQQQVHVLEERVRHSSQQLRQARDLADVAQRSIADAEGRATRAEGLLRKVDERKAAAEVERKRATEAAGLLEQQVLELQSRLEAAQHRERSAQGEAERLRAAFSKREADRAHLSGALSQLEVAEAALRDSQGTATRLLQDCTNLQRENRRLSEEDRQLTLQLQEARQEAAAAADQVQDLQATLDSVITELDIARSLLANQRHQELQQLEAAVDGTRRQHVGFSGRGGEGAFFQRIVAYPVRVDSLRFDPKADPGEGSVLDQAIGGVLGARDTNARDQHSNDVGKGAGDCGEQQQFTPGASASAWEDGGHVGVVGAAPSRQSPLTQEWSLRTQTPGTPAALRLGVTPAAARMADDPSSRGVTPESMQWPLAEEGAKAEGSVAQHPVSNQQEQQQQQHLENPSAAGSAQVALQPSQPGGGQLLGASASRPNSAASLAGGATGAVDVSDVRRLVNTVESLQRQLAVKNDRIKQLRAALQQASAAGASFTPASSRPGSAAGGTAGSREAFVLEQKLQAAEQQVESLRALTTNLERQLSDAQHAQHAQQQVQAQLAGISRRLSALLAGGEGSRTDGSLRPGSAQGSLPATSGDAAGVLRLQASHVEQVAGQVAEELEASRREAAAAQKQSSSLTLQLASRNALVDALQTQLRTLSSSGTGSGSGGSRSAQHDALLQLPPATTAYPGEAAASAADALGSLDRIVAFWRQACATKDSQLQQMRFELDQAQDALSRAEIELEAITSTAQALQEQQQQGNAVMEELQQQLTAAEQHAVAVQADEQALAVRCTELEAALMEARDAEQAERGGAREARQGCVAAEQQVQSLEQRLHIAEAQVRELQHALQLEQLSHSDGDALRQQVAALKADVATAREESAAAEQQVADLQQRLRQQEAATQAAADGSSSQLASRLDAARQAEQQLLRQVQDLKAGLAAAERQAEEAGQAVAVREVEMQQLQERLAAGEQQLSEALETVGQQSSALEDLQAALEQQQRQQQAAARAAQEELTRQLLAAQQQLSVARQEVEVLRAQAARADAEVARVAAERRHLKATEAAVQEAVQRYQRGVAVLTSTLQQLQEAEVGGESTEDRLLASLRAGSGMGPGSSSGGTSGMPVEQLVDEILLQVHRRDCQISALVAELAHLEAAMSGKARQAAEAEAQQQQHQRSLSRLKEQLHWCVKETEALKRQLSDKEAQLQQLRLRSSLGAGSGAGASVARQLSSATLAGLGSTTGGGGGGNYSSGASYGRLSGRS